MPGLSMVVSLCTFLNSVNKYVHSTNAFHETNEVVYGFHNLSDFSVSFFFFFNLSWCVGDMLKVIIVHFLYNAFYYIVYSLVKQNFCSFFFFYSFLKQLYFSL